MRQHGARAVPRAFQIDGKAARPVVLAQLERIGKYVDAGVVDQHVDAAKALDAGSDHRVNLRAIAYVGLHKEDVVAVASAAANFGGKGFHAPAR